RLLLPGLSPAARTAQRRPARRAGDADPAGPAGHALGLAAGPPALRLSAARRRGDPRILREAIARQGGAGGPGMVHGGFQQPGSAEPVAEPGGQPVHPRCGVQRAAVQPPDGAGADPLQAGHPPAGAAWLLVAGAADVPQLPRRPTLPGGAGLVPGAPPETDHRGAGTGRQRGLRFGQAMSAPPWRRLLRRLFTLALVTLIVVLLFNLVRNVDWNEVWQALRGFSPGTLLVALGLVVASYLLFSAFDLLGRAYTGHHLPLRQVLRVAFVCYSFNLNLGSWVGSVAMRYRLYSRLGLDLPTITRILSASLVTNWLGYILLAGVVFSLGLVRLPDSWRMGNEGLRIIGVLLWLVAAAYFLACRFAKRRTWHWRAHRITLPSLRFALLQAFMGALNWCLMA